MASAAQARAAVRRQPPRAHPSHHGPRNDRLAPRPRAAPAARPDGAPRTQATAATARPPTAHRRPRPAADGVPPARRRSSTARGGGHPPIRAPRPAASATRREGPAPPHPPHPRARPTAPKRRLQQLPHEPVGEPLLQRFTPRAQPTKPRGPGELQRHPQQRALADSRRAFDHDHPPRALPSRIDRVPQDAQLAIALHKTASIHRREPTGPDSRKAAPVRAAPATHPRPARGHPLKPPTTVLSRRRSRHTTSLGWPMSHDASCPGRNDATARGQTWPRPWSCVGRIYPRRTTRVAL